MIEFKYRPEVDGLRAIAVSLVLLFHAGLGFSGGFIGVDVFFVISGFLITGLILKEQHVGKFSLANFWVRRIRRIIPAATGMVVVVLLAGFFLLFPDDYEALGKSAIAQQFMLSNVFFWRKTGYFLGPSELMPLLHTWSLAVEEQFYVGYPLLLMFLHKYGRKATFGTLLCFTLFSFAISEYGVRYHRSAAFFLLPTRAWELLIGGLICFLPKPSRIPSWLSAVISWLALSAIVTAGWLYTDTTAFPGVSALVPCAATAAFIYVNSLRLSLPGVVLATKPFVFLGLISYSLYLWHWPLLAFYRYWDDATLGAVEAFALLSLAGIAAVFSWRFIETPIRQRMTIPRPRLFAITGVVVFTVLTCSGAIVIGKGFRWRVPTEVVTYANYANSKEFLYEISMEQASKREFPTLGNVKAMKSCLLWGDSHAMALASGLNSASKDLGICVYQATHSSTPPILDLVHPSKYGLNSDAPEFNRYVLNLIDNQKVDAVLLAGVWHDYARYGDFESNLRDTINEITCLGARVGVVLDVAHQDVDVPRHFSTRAFFRMPFRNGISEEVHRKRSSKAEMIIRNVCNENPLSSVLDPKPYFVNSQGLWQLEIDGALMYRDTAHLSIEGSMRLKPMFDEFLREVIPEPSRPDDSQIP